MGKKHTISFYSRGGFDSYMNFPCTCCGECCKNIGHIASLKKFDCGNGVCKNLSNTNLCKIYNQRPLICKIDELYNKFFSKHINKQTFYQKNMDACNVLQKNSYIDIKYRVHLFNEERI